MAFRLVTYLFFLDLDVPSAIEPFMKLKIPTLLLLLRVVSASPYSALKHKTGRPGIERGSPEFWYHLIVGVFLVLAGGVFSGCVCQGTSL